MMGDDIYAPADIVRCLSNQWSILVERVEEQKTGAKVTLDANGSVADILERQPLVPGDLNNAGLYVLGREIFDYPLVRWSEREYGLPQTLVRAARDFSITVVEATWWVQVTSPEDLRLAEKKLTELASSR
jgi:NDP-sugar pyrophosphorylase family protein